MKVGQTRSQRRALTPAAKFVGKETRSLSPVGEHCNTSMGPYFRHRQRKVCTKKRAINPSVVPLNISPVIEIGWRQLMWSNDIDMHYLITISNAGQRGSALNSKAPD